MSEDINYILTTEDEGLYIKEILQRRFDFSSRLMRKIKVSGNIILNGMPARLRDKGIPGDSLLVSFPEETSYFEPENIPLDVVYEDKDLLIVNKQPWLVVHPTKNYQSGTLANALAWKLKEENVNYKIRFVNRLDRDTSGLVIVAKNAHCQDFLSAESEKNRTVKKYKAIVHGIVEKDLVIDEPIDKDPNHKARRMVRPDGYPSVTR
ncbi:MAG: RluA family pseudouridine synthase, partial [Clostridia bacterium]|nr:RluA family pseudouridine synthase [Clostridia bacterium]